MERERFLNILGLMDYRIFTINENEHDFHIQAELITSPSCCAHCGHPKIHRHEVKPQLYMDIPIRNKHVGIIVQCKRYLCCGCRYDIYGAPTKEIALQRYFAWFEQITLDIYECFLPFTLAIEHYGDAIINYFTYRYTAGYTECLNGLLKLLAREGRGFRFEVIRAFQVNQKALEKSKIREVFFNQHAIMIK